MRKIANEKFKTKKIAQNTEERNGKLLLIRLRNYLLTGYEMLEMEWFVLRMCAAEGMCQQ